MRTKKARYSRWEKEQISRGISARDIRLLRSVIYGQGEPTQKWTSFSFRGVACEDLGARGSSSGLSLIMRTVIENANSGGEGYRAGGSKEDPSKTNFTI